MEPYEITRILKLRGITQRQIATRLGVTQAAVSGVIHGKASVRIQQAIANTLGMSIDDIFPLKNKASITENNPKRGAET